MRALLHEHAQRVEQVALLQRREHRARALLLTVHAPEHEERRRAARVGIGSRWIVAPVAEGEVAETRGGDAHERLELGGLVRAAVRHRIVAAAAIAIAAPSLAAQPPNRREQTHARVGERARWCVRSGGDCKTRETEGVGGRVEAVQKMRSR